MNETKIDVKELKNVLKHVINNNNLLQQKGIVPIAINVVGPAGLGKTSVITQVAKDCRYKKENIVKLNLASFEEIGDLIGIPMTEYKMGIPTEKGLKVIWVTEKAITSYNEKGYKVMNKTRMSYSVPEWIAGKTEGGVLILDDYSRASQRFTQAVMELILTQEYATWKLPKGWTIILSSNPDDGVYNVTDQDPAQKTRFLTVHLKWNVEIWAEWAEKNNIDQRCINFTLMNPEIVADEAPEINARSISMLYNSIASIPDFKQPEGLEMIKLLGEGSLGEVFSTQLVAFIHGDMDKLITIQRILNTDIPFLEIESEIKESVKEGTEYRGDIAYVFATRIINYLKVNYQEEAPLKITERVGELIKSKVLGSDLKFVIGKKITAFKSGAFSKLLADPEILGNIIN